MVYTWNVKSANILDKGDNTNVITSINWILTATEGEHTVIRTGVQALDTSNISSFTSFSDLTEEQVIGWVETAMGAEKLSEIKLDMNKEMDSKISEITTTMLFMGE